MNFQPLTIHSNMFLSSGGKCRQIESYLCRPAGYVHGKHFARRSGWNPGRTALRIDGERLKFGKILEQPQAFRLAFFGVELRGEDVVVPDRRANGPA